MPKAIDYTVGWLCAIATEYTAAREFLDETHDVSQCESTHDSNSNTLGRIGKHYVVIAVLPDGNHGTASATDVTRNMLHAFPNLRIILMVGIGSGAPTSETDIRLGDVVVSAPHSGGVFHYEFDKATQTQEYQVTGPPNPLCAALRAAVNRLEAQYELQGCCIGDEICAVLQKKPALRKAYERPEIQDRLYRPEVIHPQNDDRACTTTCSNDSSSMIRRRHRDNNLVVHYGPIASGSQVLKDAVVRDRLSKEKGILCFQAEAVEWMRHFPSLIIRGICDYADSHRNEEWRGYAAMAAAVYAKDVLSCVHPTHLEAERKLSELHSSVGQNIPDTKATTVETDSVARSITQRRRADMNKWLSPADPSTNFSKAMMLRHEKSGQWFLQSSAYTSWRMEPKSFLWLNGKPGCGKTILTSTIIEDLRKRCSYRALLYFYFDFSDTSKQSLEGMIRSLIYQLYCQKLGVQDPLDALYSTCNSGTSQPHIDSLCTAFQRMIELAGGAQIVVDALDECPSRNPGLLGWIQRLYIANKSVRLLTSSRPEQDIESSITDWAEPTGIITLQSDEVRADIWQYTHARVLDHEGLSRWRGLPEVQKEIESALVEKADGTFRWVACQLDALEHCLSYPTLQEALKVLPRTLDETYARILHTIPPEDWSNTIRMLQFLTYSERPLRIEEAVDAIAVDLTQRPRYDIRNKTPWEIPRHCSSLVAIIDRELSDGQRIPEIQLSHFSVKEWLVSGRLGKEFSADFTETAARATIALICLAYLLELDHSLRPHEITQVYPFAEYSARYWAENAAASEATTQAVTDMTMEFLLSETAFQTSIHLYDPDEPWRGVSEQSMAPSTLYFAARQGLFHSTRLLLEKSPDININGQGGKHGNALSVASSKGHEAIVRLLLQKGADANAQSGAYGNALQAASTRGHDAIARILLEKDADVNAQSGEYGSALQAASTEGHEAIVQMLLERDADVNAQSGEYGNALQAASANGHKAIVMLLLAHDADVNAQGGEYGNALQAASANGHKAIVMLLLAHDADVNAQDGEYGNALQAASAEGYIRITQLLLAHGADVNAQGGEYGNALQAASAEGYIRITQLLLAHGADVNAQGGEYGNALQAASERGHEELVQLLIERGANVNARIGEHSNHPDMWTITAVSAPIHREPGHGNNLGNVEAMAIRKSIPGMDHPDSMGMNATDDTSGFTDSDSSDAGSETSIATSIFSNVSLGATQATIDQGLNLEEQVAAVLFHDKEARTLYEDALQKLSVEGFTRQHNDLLKRYFRDLRKYCDTRLQFRAVRKLRGARQRERLTELITQWSKTQRQLDLERREATKEFRDHSLNGVLQLAADTRAPLLGPLREPGKVGKQTPSENDGNTLARARQQSRLGQPDLLEVEDSDTDTPDVREEKNEELPLDSIAAFLAKGPPFAALKARLRYLVNPPSNIHEALSTNSIDLIEVFLDKRFSQAAVGEYSWMRELKDAGIKGREIAELLYSASHDSPWIFFRSRLTPQMLPIHIRVNYHTEGCPHRLQAQTGQELPAAHSAAHSASWIHNMFEDGDVHRSVEELCGLGGVAPISRELSKWNGTVLFKEKNSVAHISHSSSSSTLNDLQGVLSRLRDVTERFMAAVCLFQNAEFCCESFTVLTAVDHGHDGGRFQLRLRRVAFARTVQFIELFQDMCAGLQTDNKDVCSRRLVELSRCSSSLLSIILSEAEIGTLHAAADPVWRVLHLSSLTLQVLCVGLLSYSRAHIGRLRPFFLDTALREMMLMGLESSVGRNVSVRAHVAHLTCLAGMAGDQVMVLCSPRNSDHLDSASRFDLCAAPEDILDTWGPGHLICHRASMDSPVAIMLAGGFIVPPALHETTGKYHWSREFELPQNSPKLKLKSEIVIGALVQANNECPNWGNACWQAAMGQMDELGTDCSYWETTEHQYGIQGGQYVVAFATRTKAKRPGINIKQAYLQQPTDHDLIEFLSCPWGVRVSCCTGVAQRVLLRHLVGDLLAVFAATRSENDREWDMLQSCHRVVEKFKGTCPRAGGTDPLGIWLGHLPCDLRSFLLGLIRDILRKLAATGLNTSKELFSVAWPTIGRLNMCVRVQVKDDYARWMPMLADSTDCATFAYMTDTCLEAGKIRCHGRNWEWKNRIPLLETAVLCPASPTQWALRHGQTYFFLQLDRDLFWVKADKDPSTRNMPAVLRNIHRMDVIMDQIRYRIQEAWNSDRRLCERKLAFKQNAEVVIVLSRKF